MKFNFGQNNRNMEQKFNLERARAYEEQKIPSLKLYYSLVNKKLFFSVICLAILSFGIVNVLVGLGNISLASQIIIGVVILGVIFGTITGYKTPNALPKNSIITYTQARLMNVVYAPFGSLVITAIGTVLTVGIIALALGKAEGNIFTDNVYLTFNSLLTFSFFAIFIWLMKYYSDRDLDRYSLIKRQYIAEGKTLEQVFRSQDSSYQLPTEPMAVERIEQINEKIKFQATIPQEIKSKYAYLNKILVCLLVALTFLKLTVLIGVISGLGIFAGTLFVGWGLLINIILIFYVARYSLSAYIFTSFIAIEGIIEMCKAFVSPNSNVTVNVFATINIILLLLSIIISMKLANKLFSFSIKRVLSAMKGEQKK
jgi:hypothetical protein